jgi:hypothetical protein
MRFTCSGRRAAKQISASGRRGRFFNGGLALATAGWVLLHPLPRAPDLPLAARARLKRLEAAASEMRPVPPPPVWVDTRSGAYYLPGSPGYGHTPGGRYLGIRVAKAQGYHSLVRRD